MTTIERELHLAQRRRRRWLPVSTLVILGFASTLKNPVFIVILVAIGFLMAWCVLSYRVNLLEELRTLRSKK